MSFGLAFRKYRPPFISVVYAGVSATMLLSAFHVISHGVALCVLLLVVLPACLGKVLLDRRTKNAEVDE